MNFLDRLACIVFLLCSGMGLLAQTTANVDSGSVVRIFPSIRSLSYLTGSVVSFDGNSIAIQPEDSDELKHFDLNEITSLEIRVARKKPSTSKYALIGLIAGAGAGVALTYGIFGRGGDENEYYPEYIIPTSAAGGLLVGTILGAASSSHTWKEIPLEDFRE